MDTREGWGQEKVGSREGWVLENDGYFGRRMGTSERWALEKDGY